MIGSNLVLIDFGNSLLLSEKMRLWQRISILGFLSDYFQSEMAVIQIRNQLYDLLFFSNQKIISAILTSKLIKDRHTSNILYYLGNPVR